MIRCCPKHHIELTRTIVSVQGLAVWGCGYLPSCGGLFVIDDGKPRNLTADELEDLARQIQQSATLRVVLWQSRSFREALEPHYTVTEGW